MSHDHKLIQHRRHQPGKREAANIDTERAQYLARIPVRSRPGAFLTEVSRQKSFPVIDGAQEYSSYCAALWGIYL